jgi:hypothetical protein
MTKKSKVVEKKGLTYLKGFIARGMTQTQLFTDVSNQLNEMKITPKIGRSYNFGIVQSVWYGKYEDEKVEQLLKEKLMFN